MTKKLLLCGWNNPGLSDTYFKTIICIVLYGDDNTGLYNFVPFVFIRGHVCIKCQMWNQHLFKEVFGMNIIGDCSHFLMIFLSLTFSVFLCSIYILQKKLILSPCMLLLIYDTMVFPEGTLPVKSEKWCPVYLKLINFIFFGDVRTFWVSFRY